MIISVVSPHARRNGNTVSSILLGLALGELKRKVLLTHIKPQSHAFEVYLGLKVYEDKTSTPSQLVKLMREGAIKPEEITDYTKTITDFLDVFTNTASNFSEEDMTTLLKFVTESTTDYEYIVVDIDAEADHETSKLVLGRSDVVILNVSPNFLELDDFNRQKEEIMKMCKGKKVILLCSLYDTKACKLKEVSKHLGVKTNPYMIRENSWVKYGCNFGKLDYIFSQARNKDIDVIEVGKDATALASAVSKAKIAIAKSKKAKGGLQ